MTPERLGRLVEFAAAVAELAECWPVSVTSWFRSTLHNRQVGGATYSRHLDGLAVDFVFDHDQVKPGFLDHVKRLGLHFLNEGDHVHVQDRAPLASGRAVPLPKPAPAPAGGRAQGGVPLSEAQPPQTKTSQPIR